MELIRQFAARHPTGFAAYLALEIALMRRFIARGGTEEEFCTRLAPAFHRRYGPALLGNPTRVLPLRTLRSLVSDRAPGRPAGRSRPLSAAPAA